MPVGGREHGGVRFLQGFVIDLPRQSEIKGHIHRADRQDIDAFDGVSHAYRGSAETPFSVTVQTAVADSAKGDVNGDGRISSVDALMVLRAVNGRLNLTAEQFARADINGDGELSAAEAMRILQYANGKIASVLY